ncbi:hypothetical protein VTL71DRAFT_14138 [Oculimacula yallundae]|uniref:Uncharacterized protein n=1 Tax=Oculimacula yallundae TaxID=86028 RepID=A0ABR4CHL9_9HELO
MSAICPDNSTECLLRALLEAQSSFNWDPLSFAFTAAIGVLAVIVAGITVFQGLLSAGPGRLKASKAAIGTFAVNTKTKFHWDELRYRTTARVPFIKAFDRLKPSETGTAVYEVRVYPARWVTLLECACLTGIPGSLEIEIRYVKVVTDHLPADVTAPPAWTTVKNAVILACTAGCNVVTMDESSVYPRVRGPTCQLRFREHPDLGTVAVFDLLVQKRYYPFDIRPDLLQEIWNENLEGPIAYDGNHSMSLDLFDFQKLLPDLHSRRGNCQHQLCKMVGNPAKIEWLLKSAANHSFHGLGAVFAPLVARIPVSPRVANFAAGPTGLLSILKKLANAQERDRDYKDPVLLGFALEINVANVYDLGDQDLDHVAIGDEEMGWSWLYSSGSDARRRPRMDVPYGKGGEQEIRVVAKLLGRAELELDSIAEEDIESESSMRPATFPTIIRTAHWRRMLQFQLLEIDWWLLKRGGSLAACETISFWWDVIKTAMIECADIPFDDDVRTFDFSSDHFRENISKTGSATMTEEADSSTAANQEPAGDQEAKLPARSKTKKHTKKEIEGFAKELEERKKLREILMFRAAVWTLYLGTAADISSVLDNDVGERIIQLL